MTLLAILVRMDFTYLVMIAYNVITAYVQLVLFLLHLVLLLVKESVKPVLKIINVILVILDTI